MICQFFLLLVMMIIACRPSGPKVVEKPDLEDLPPFDPSTQQSVAYLEISHAAHFLESNPDAIVLDARGREDYDKVHLPNAVSFPYDFEKMSIKKELAAHPDYDTKKIYFIYGSKKDFHATDIANRMKGMGYQYLFCVRNESGIEDWIKAGLPVVSTAAVNE